MFKYKTKDAFQGAVKKADAARIKTQLALLTAAAVCAPTPVYARTAESVIGSVLDYAVLIFPLIGVPLVLVGFFKLFMAYRNNQPDEYSAAAKDVAIGAVMIVFQTLIWPGLRNAIM